MKIKHQKKIGFYLIFIVFMSHSINLVGDEEISKGKIIEKIICTQSPEHSYALYLPSGYNPEKRWPIIYALDPGARGALPLEHFRVAAETYGFILAGSNDSRNGPWEPIFRAVISVWNDTQERFSIDLNRVYVTGFSGGSRAAAYFSRIIGEPVTAVIGCGAGLPSQMKPSEIKPSFYCGVVGRKDMTYLEMMELDDKFDEAGVPHRFFVFDGIHEWPTESVCMRAVEWLEVVSMDRGIRSYDEHLVKRIFNREYDRALEQEKQGNLIISLSNYENLLSLFKEKINTALIEENIDRLKGSNEYFSALNMENKIRTKELEFTKKFQDLLNFIGQNPVLSRDLEKVFEDFDIPSLKKMVLKGDKSESEMAFRLLYGLEIDSRDMGWDSLNKMNPKKAALFLEIAVEANYNERSRLRYLYYNLAAAYALDQNKNKAIKNLKLAIENGFDDLEYLKKDESFKSIRATDEFQKLVNKKV